MSIHYNCERIGRRDCLKLGLSAATGLGFADLLRLRGLASESAKSVPASIAKPKVMAAQPTSGGTAPAAPPMTMLWIVVRLSHRV